MRIKSRIRQSIEHGNKIFIERNAKMGSSFILGIYAIESFVIKLAKASSNIEKSKPFMEELLKLFDDKKIKRNEIENFFGKKNIIPLGKCYSALANFTSFWYGCRNKPLLYALSESWAYRINRLCEDKKYNEAIQCCDSAIKGDNSVQAKVIALYNKAKILYDQTKQEESKLYLLNIGDNVLSIDNVKKCLNKEDLDHPVLVQNNRNEMCIYGQVYRNGKFYWEIIRIDSQKMGQILHEKGLRFDNKIWMPSEMPIEVYREITMRRAHCLIQYIKSMEYIDKAIKIILADISVTSSVVAKNIIKDLDIEVCLLKGLVLEDLRQYEDACKCLDEITAKYEDCAVAWHRKGIVLMENLSERSEKTEGCFKKAISLNPNYINAISALGCLYLYTKRYDNAIAQFKETLNKDPNYYPAIINIIYALPLSEKGDKKKNCDGAIEESYRAREINSRVTASIEWNYYTGLAHFGSEKYVLALYAYNLALKITPEQNKDWWENDYYSLHMLYARIWGDKAAAYKKLKGTDKEAYETQIHKNGEDEKTCFDKAKECFDFAAKAKENLTTRKDHYSNSSLFACKKNGAEALGFNSPDVEKMTSNGGDLVC